MTAIYQQQKRPSSLPYESNEGPLINQPSAFVVFCLFQTDFKYTFYTRALSRVAAPRHFFGRSLGLGGWGRKGSEKSDAPAWSTDTLDFVVSLNVLAPLDSDRIFSPKALAQRQRPAWGGVAGASCFAGEGWGLLLVEGFRCFS